MQFLCPLVAFAAIASATALNLRGDAQYSSPTCGVNKATHNLDHNDIQNATVAFGAWLDAGADGQVSGNGNFKGSLGVSHSHLPGYLSGNLAHVDIHLWQKTTGQVTIFACDGKKSGGSVISSRLVSGATGTGGYLDTKCGVDNAGYEQSNDLTIGRTFVSPFQISLGFGNITYD